MRPPWWPVGPIYIKPASGWRSLAPEPPKLITFNPPRRKLRRARSEDIGGNMKGPKSGDSLTNPITVEETESLKAARRSVAWCGPPWRAIDCALRSRSAIADALQDVLLKRMDAMNRVDTQQRLAEGVLIKVADVLSSKNLKFSECFRRWYKSGSGRVDIHQLRSGLLHLGLKATSQEINALTACLDQDSHGNVGLIYFDKLLKRVMQGSGRMSLVCKCGVCFMDDSNFCTTCGAPRPCEDSAGSSCSRAANKCVLQQESQTNLRSNPKERREVHTAPRNMTPPPPASAARAAATPRGANPVDRACSLRRLGHDLAEEWVLHSGDLLAGLKKVRVTGLEVTQICGLLTYLGVAIAMDPHITARRLVATWRGDAVRGASTRQRVLETSGGVAQACSKEALDEVREDWMYAALWPGLEDRAPPPLPVAAGDVTPPSESIRTVRTGRIMTKSQMHQALCEFARVITVEYGSVVDAFEAFDASGNCKLSRAEFCQSAGEIYKGDAIALFEALDNQCSGQLSIREFKELDHFFAQHRAARAKLREFARAVFVKYNSAQAAFRALDTKHSGELTTAAFRMGASSFFRGDPFEVFDVLDKERTGSISMKEFAIIDKLCSTRKQDTLLRDFAKAIIGRYGSASAAFKAIDTNRDNIASKAEFCIYATPLFKGDTTALFEALDFDANSNLSLAEFKLLDDVYAQQCAEDPVADTVQTRAMALSRRHALTNDQEAWMLELCKEPEKATKHEVRIVKLVLNPETATSRAEEARLFSQFKTCETPNQKAYKHKLLKEQVEQVVAYDALEGEPPICTDDDEASLEEVAYDALESEPPICTDDDEATLEEIVHSLALPAGVMSPGGKTCGHGRKQKKGDAPEVETLPTKVSDARRGKIKPDGELLGRKNEGDTRADSVLCAGAGDEAAAVEVVMEDDDEVGPTDNAQRSAKSGGDELQETAESVNRASNADTSDAVQEQPDKKKLKGALASLEGWRTASAMPAKWMRSKVAALTKLKREKDVPELPEGADGNVDMANVVKCKLKKELDWEQEAECLLEALALEGGGHGRLAMAGDAEHPGASELQRTLESGIPPTSMSTA